MVTVLKRKNQLLFGVEALLSFIAVAICMMTRFQSTDMSELLLTEKVWFKLLLYSGILWLSIFLNDLHQVQVLVDKRSLLPRLAKASVVAVVLYALVTAIIPDHSQGRIVFMFSLLLTNGLFLILYELLGRFLESRAFLERVLVLGDGKLARNLRQLLYSGDYRQVLVDDPRIEARVIESLTLAAQGNPEGREQLSKLDEVVDLVVMAFEGEAWPEELPPGAEKDRVARGVEPRVIQLDSRARGTNHQVPRIRRPYLRHQRSDQAQVELLLRGLTALKLSNVSVLRGLDYYEQLTGRVFLGSPADPLFFSGAQFRIDKVSFLLKDAYERLAAAIGLVMVLPFLILVPIAIWFDTGRPLLFVQPRVGRCGRVYKLYKWRSMDDKGNVTRVGKFIRKTKLDELPQLINVLKGEMSLVGPRPELPKFVEEFRQANSYYELRLMVKPGLTGWAQIMFPDAKAEDAMTKLSYDLYYVKHFSLVSDIVIMMETFKMIVFGGVARVAKFAAPRAELGTERKLELLQAPETNPPVVGRN